MAHAPSQPKPPHPMGPRPKSLKAIWVGQGNLSRLSRTKRHQPSPLASLCEHLQSLCTEKQMSWRVSR